MNRTRSTSSKHVKTLIGERYFKSNISPPTKVYVDWTGVTRTSDICSDWTSPGPPYRWVNNLVIDHTKHPAYTTGTQGDVWIQNSGLYEYRYRGLFWVTLGASAPTWPPEASAVLAQSMSGLGASGWSKFQPGKPLADMGVFLGESRELPGQFRDAVKALKQLAFHPLKTVRNMSFAANQHLAIQFGWLPLLRDLEKFRNALNRTDDWLNRIKKYNRKWEHRGGTISQGDVTTTVGTGYISPSPSGVAMPSSGISYAPVEVRTRYKIWFSGWFKYYIADFESPHTQLRLKARLYGLTQTPTIVWNLLPWSWLVDWFSNVGDNINNLCPIDGLVAKMPCVMRHTETDFNCSAVQQYKEPDGKITTISASNSKRLEKCERFVASPFGFGLSWDNFTLRQLSILAALGIQRAPF